MNTPVELADYAVSRCPNLQGQLEHIEAREVLEIIVGFVEDAAARGCAEAAFRVVQVALERAAYRVLANSRETVQ